MNNGMCVLIENSERETTIPYLVLAEDLVCPTIDQKKLNEKIQQQTYDFAISMGMTLNKNDILCDSEEKIQEVSDAIDKRNNLERNLYNSYK